MIQEERELFLASLTREELQEFTRKFSLMAEDTIYGHYTRAVCWEAIATALGNWLKSDLIDLQESLTEKDI